MYSIAHMPALHVQRLQDNIALLADACNCSLPDTIHRRVQSCNQESHHLSGQKADLRLQSHQEFDQKLELRLHWHQRLVMRHQMQALHQMHLRHQKPHPHLQKQGWRQKQGLTELQRQQRIVHQKLAWTELQMPAASKT